MDPKTAPIRATTQSHLEIEDIRDGLVILKDGGAVLVVATTAINFGLLSEKEQDATIYAYAALLNSLTFSIQIVVRSQKKDISGYLKLLDRAHDQTIKPEVKQQIATYRQFVKEIVTKNEVLDKKFYIAIPMSKLEVGVSKTFISSLKRRKGLPYPKEYILEKAKSTLLPKRDHILKQLGRLGLKGHQLSTQELIQLYFEIYNPDAGRPALGQMADYSAPIVQAVRDSRPTSKKSAPGTAAQPAGSVPEVENAGPAPAPASHLPPPTTHDSPPTPQTDVALRAKAPKIAPEAPGQKQSAEPASSTPRASPQRGPSTPGVKTSDALASIAGGSSHNPSPATKNPPPTTHDSPPDLQLQINHLVEEAAKP